MLLDSESWDVPNQKHEYEVYDLKLTVREIQPAIWRRIMVRSDMTLARLHLVMQVLMGWYDYHLYQFRIDNAVHGPPRDDDEDYGTRESVRISLATVFQKKPRMISYEYDFGDGWEIEINIEKTYPGEAQLSKAVCLAGARHGPMEDSGGPHGYQQMLRILKNPRHKEYTETKQWIGYHFNAERFEVESTNELLEELDRRKGNPQVLKVFWDMRITPGRFQRS
jgi:hypothetical protein